MLFYDIRIRRRFSTEFLAVPPSLPPNFSLNYFPFLAMEQKGDGDQRGVPSSTPRGGGPRWRREKRMAKFDRGLTEDCFQPFSSLP